MRAALLLCFISRQSRLATVWHRAGSPAFNHTLACTFLQNPLGMPRVSRTMNQVQQLSERMVSRIQHRDTATDGLASARLLAQQGLNQRQ